MTYQNLQQKIQLPLFSMLQVRRVFDHESAHSVRMQISRFVKRGLLIRLKQGLFQFADRQVDELAVAAFLYQPSYISLETALSIHGVIPDVPAEITSVTTVTTNAFKVSDKWYRYNLVQPRMFFGFESRIDGNSGLNYQLAQPEKAVLDWIYLRKLASVADMRVAFGELDQRRLQEYAAIYPMKVRRVIHEQFGGSI